MATKADIQDWVERHPVRRWRRQEGLSVHSAASMLGVSTSSIQQYEAGATHPRDETIERMAERMGRTPENLRRAWTNWEAKRP